MFDFESGFDLKRRGIQPNDVDERHGVRPATSNDGAVTAGNHPQRATVVRATAVIGRNPYGISKALPRSRSQP